jgi:hypothetical protein
MMLFLNLLFQFLAVGVVVLTSTLDYVVWDKRTRYFKSFRTCLFIAAGLFFVAGIVVTVGNEIGRREEVAALKLELNRNLHQIKSVSLDFRISLPMNDPALEGYSGRIKQIIQSWNDSKLIPIEDGGSGMTIPFGHGSRMLPDVESERSAYTFLSVVGIGLELFADPDAAEAFVSNAGVHQRRGDLVLHLSRSASDLDKHDVFLHIDGRNQSFWIFGEVYAGMPKRNTEKISSILDLAGITGVVYFYPIGYRDDRERLEFERLAAKRELRDLGLVFSDGQKLRFRPEPRMNKHGERVYVLRFPQARKEIESLIQE